ncbi:DUF1992 domain-containing protein [Ktedonosporobacter rubrisoli]|uniref:DUF1992 domain-containing protein n=1 Tax=Ktedonosporobacter rubrisoli TaxID=2509675 RepID=A0A4P6K2Q0_KTERU|nr:DUF1992 domain-containing protein [Ktedonosporobacter rubrisoli]QBD82305.1 DUF1992 domain-containing protein [Ktedonosporobacter rubrisoli]
MDFVDWRKSSDKMKIGQEQAEESAGPKRRGKNFAHYIEEQIYEAQVRGDFSNLPGEGKPLQLDDDSAAGDMALSYHVLKSHGFAPAEIELAKEIRTEMARAEKKLAKVMHQSKALRTRRVPPFPSEKRSFNIIAGNAAAEYEKTLRGLNRKIMTLNLSTPTAMHQKFIEVEKHMQDFWAACPLFEDVTTPS